MSLARQTQQWAEPLHPSWMGVWGALDSAKVFVPAVAKVAITGLIAAVKNLNMAIKTAHGNS